MSKKKIIIGAVVLVLVIVGIILLCCCGSKEEELNNSMEKLGKSFYEDYYYPSQKKSQKDIKKYMEKFSKNGISINLDNLTKISSLDKDLMKEVKDLAKKEKCNNNETKIVITPKKDYGEKDYTLKIDLKCDKIK